VATTDLLGLQSTVHDPRISDEGEAQTTKHCDVWCKKVSSLEIWRRQWDNAWKKIIQIAGLPAAR